MIVGVVGLGLMGGSFAKALKKYNLSQKIYGYDHNQEHQKDALKLNLVDEIVDFEKIKGCDLIVLAIPVDAIVSTLQNLKDIKPSSTIIDLGSTKNKIIKNIPHQIRDNFVATHPMTGTEKFGPNAAIDGLYENKVVVLCDLENSGKIHREKIIHIFTTLQMNIIQMSAEEHDSHASFISHLPHIISYSLANTVMRREDKDSIISLAAGGFRDMSRIAKSSPNMWCDIFRQNQDNLLESINLFEKELKILKESIENDDWERLYSELEYANRLHDIL